MKESMLANVYHAPRDLRLEKIPVPEAGPGDLLVRVGAAAVCASDVRVFKGEKKAKAGTILGHEFAGEVAEKGRDVEEFTVGDRVTVYPVIFCGSCFYCQMGQPNICVKRKTLGYDYNGAFAEYILIPNQLVKMGNVVKIPDKVSSEEAALTEPLGCSINGIRVLNLQPGENLLIVGSGPMGLMLLAVARSSGASTVMVSEISEERRNFAKKMGADVVVNPKEEDVVKRALEETEGLGVDAAVVSVGMPSAAKDALQAVRKGGRVNFFAGFPIGSEMSLDPNLIHYRMLHVTASQNAPLSIFKTALLMMSKGKVDLKPLITSRFPLKDVKLAIEKRTLQEGLKTEIIPSLEALV